jgi:phospholipid/cholesterol/gamma-HCH transport system substrate-binding protein
MKKISHEVKIGITALITILVFIWLYNFLKGKDLFSKSTQYYVVYDKVGGLAESSPVEVNGYKVGVVQSVRFLDPESGRLVVTLTVDKGFKLPSPIWLPKPYVIFTKTMHYPL